MLRFALSVTFLLMLAVGQALYWLPQQAADVLGASPLWLVRGAGALASAYALGVGYSAWRPDPSGTLLGAAGNLLLAATLGAAAYRLSAPQTLETLLWGLCALTLALGLLVAAGSGAVFRRRPLPATPTVGERNHD